MMNNLLVLIAHHDDELFMLQPLRNHLKAGDTVHICYLGYSSNFGKHDNLRVQESLKTLIDIGIPHSNIINLGSQKDFQDGNLFKHSEELLKSLQVLYGENEFSHIYTHAWEGGHHDHDAVHIVAKAFAKLLNIVEIYEFPYYNAYQVPRPLFKVMSFPPNNLKILSCSMDFQASKYLIKTIFNYKTQWKTFIGLSLGILYKLFIQRRIDYRLIQDINYNTKPHTGELLYERRFKIKFEDFCFKNKEFVEKYIL